MYLYASEAGLGKVPVMDFGLSRFLEMFEERFGRKVTTVLLAVMALGLFGFSLHLVYTTLIRPGYAMGLAIVNGGWSFPFTQKEIFAGLLSAVEAALISALLFWFVTVGFAEWYLRKRSRHIRDVSENVASLFDEVQAAHKETLELLDEIKQHRDEGGEFLAEAKAREKLMLSTNSSAEPPLDPTLRASPEKT